MTVTAAPDRLHFTGDDEADRLLVSDPLALLIGFALDQQVPVQKAFSGPMELKRRIGHLDPRRIAEMDAEQLADVFRAASGAASLPGGHGGSRAGAVRLRGAGVRRTGGRVWTEASDGRDLRARLKALPSFGDMKVRSMLGILSKRYRPSCRGWTWWRRTSDPGRRGLAGSAAGIPGGQAGAQGREMPAAEAAEGMKREAGRGHSPASSRPSAIRS